MIITKNTKIVATLGPASTNSSALEAMLRAGTNVVRINCSHGDHASYKIMIDLVRTVASKLKYPIAIIFDLGGPKIRIGDFQDGQITLKRGKKFILTTKKIIGNEHRVFVNYPRLPREVRRGTTILLDDGQRELLVERTTKDEVHCTIKEGGQIRNRRGLNIPNASLSIPTISKKDWDDIAFGLKQGVDYFALSFVRKADDVLELRDFLTKKRSGIHIIAKIETRQACENIDGILDAAEGIMVARGDLAVEIAKEEVPLMQKMMIDKARKMGRVVITATQMLDSMTTQHSPTRAEVSDVANAIFDGSDAVMLSQETAIGVDPAHVVRTMAGIARTVEQSTLYQKRFHPTRDVKGVVDAIGRSVSECLLATDAKAIVALSESGFTAKMVARQRPHVPILALTPYALTYRQLALVYAAIPHIIPPVTELHRALAITKTSLKQKKLARKNDHYILVAGVPFGIRGGTNALIVQSL